MDENGSENFQNLLVIGNGFDLALGVKSSYGDYINSPNFDSFRSSGAVLAGYLHTRFAHQNWVDIEAELSVYSQLGYANGFKGVCGRSL